MTTIAWDGDTLAADRKGIQSGVPREVRKLFEDDRFAYGGTGALDEAHIVWEWFRAGAEPKDRPSLDEAGVAGIVVEKSTGKAYFVEGKRPVLCEIHEKMAATGSGRDFALAAMAFGKSAADAVQFASKFDVSTGSVVDTIEIAKPGENEGGTRQ